MRRSKLKVAANLSTARRSCATRPSSQQNENTEVEKTPKFDKKVISDDVPTKLAEPASGLTLSDVASPGNSSSSLTNNEKNVSGESLEVLNEKSLAVASPVAQSADLENQKPSSTFKAPMEVPRVENEASSSTQPSSTSKFKKAKPAPRLNASRNVAKTQVSSDVAKTPLAPPSPVTPVPNDPVPPAADFTPPTPTRTRPETPLALYDAPSFITNHNVQHAPAPPSPFPMGHGHSRIRTESLCSVKSYRDYPVANLQPRKNIRSEDQKMIDVKRESRERLSNKDLDKSKLRMIDMIYFNPATNPMKPRSPHKAEKPKKVEIFGTPPEPTTTPSAMPVPQLRLNANGEMVLDETSLVVENEQQKQNRILLASNTVVYDDDLSGNGYYKRQQRTKEWSQEETVKFYRCLNTVGTDFSLMLNLFPNRSRRDLKLKFKKEERSNPMLIDKALLKHNTFDLDELQRELDEEEAERRKEAEAKSKSEVKEHLKQKILKKQEAKLKAQQQAKSKIERILNDGDLAIEMVDNNNLPLEAKENLEMKQGVVPVKKRQYRRKPKPEPAETEDVPKSTIAKVEKISADEATPPAAKKPRKSRKNEPQNLFEDCDGKILGKMMHVQENTYEMPKKEESAVQPVSTYKLEEIPVVYSSKIEPSTFTTTIFFDESGSQIQCGISQDQHDTKTANNLSESVISAEKLDLSQPPNELDSVDEMAINEALQNMTDEINTSECYPTEQFYNTSQDMEPFELPCPGTSQPNYEVPCSENAEYLEAPGNYSFIVNSSEGLDFKAQDPSPPAVQVIDIETLPPIPIEVAPEPEPSKTEKKPKSKSRKKKFKPSLVTRLKLDANGDMVPDDDTPEEVEANNPTQQAIKAEEIPAETFQIPVDENLNETKNEIIRDQDLPTTSQPSAEAFDEDVFLDSLDMEKLFIVQVQRDGNDVYEIHGTDPITHEMCDKPMDLPQRISDLLITIMTQQDDDE